MSGRESTERGTNGQFAKGNRGGPGRPRRAIEREYLATLAETVPLDVWRSIIERAVQDAQAGDSKARDWLAKYLLGPTPVGLTDLAAAETNGTTPAAVVQRRAHELLSQALARLPTSDNETDIFRGLVLKRDAL